MDKFAFVIHPMDVRRDAAKKIPVLRYLPTAVVEQLMLRISPKVMSHITGVRSITGVETEGWLVGCPLSPRQLLELPAETCYQRIVDCGKLAADLGAKIVGLGALTAVVGDAGITVAERLQGIINVTTGNSYTVYTAIEGLLHAAELLEVDIANARVVVIGASGSIGAVCARMLAAKVADVALVGRNQDKLAAVHDTIVAEAKGASVWVTADMKEALRDADLVLAVSSSKDALIFPEDLKSGAIVCDVARPRDVSTMVAARPDVLVIEGGVIEVPGPVDFHFDFGFPPRTAYACMSETMMMALEGTFEPFSLGRDLNLEQIERSGAIAAKHGFKLAGFRSFEKPVTPETIERVRAQRQRLRRPAPREDEPPSTALRPVNANL